MKQKVYLKIKSSYLKSYWYYPLVGRVIVARRKEFGMGWTMNNQDFTEEEKQILNLNITNSNTTFSEIDFEDGEEISKEEFFDFYNKITLSECIEQLSKQIIVNSNG